jgi:hypothetical protein
MDAVQAAQLIERRYREVFSAQVHPSFDQFMDCGPASLRAAVVGYRRAGAEPLFLERYLDEPVEAAIARAMGRRCTRREIVEIGNFAADDALAMLDLWGSAANDLGHDSEFAVATLTAPLRRIFARIGIPVHVLAPATVDRLGDTDGDWGTYYAQDPQVCVGLIAEGQRAIAAWRQRPSARKVAA